MTMTVNYDLGGTTYTHTFEGSHNIVRRNTSEFGADWTYNMLDRLVVQSDGVMVLNGLNESVWFADLGGGVYAREQGDLEFSTLAKNVNGTYTLTAKDQSRREFNTLGLLTQLIDRNNNVINYSYADRDGDLVADEINQITDFAGRTMTFGYTSGLVTSVTDFDGKVTALAYTGGRITRPTSRTTGSIATSSSASAAPTASIASTRSTCCRSRVRAARPPTTWSRTRAP